MSGYQLFSPQKIVELLLINGPVDKTEIGDQTYCTILFPANYFTCFYDIFNNSELDREYLYLFAKLLLQTEDGLYLNSTLFREELEKMTENYGVIFHFHPTGNLLTMTLGEERMNEIRNQYTTEQHEMMNQFSAQLFETYEYYLTKEKMDAADFQSHQYTYRPS